MEEDPEETPDFNEDLTFPDDDEANDTFEVCDKTEKFLEECCTQPLPYARRTQIRNKLGGLPRASSTRTPKMDGFLKSEVSTLTKSLDKDLARIQHHMLDALGPLSAIVDADYRGESLSHQEVLTAVKGACRLLGNASCRLSQLRKEVISEVKKSLVPLVKQEDFNGSTPNLFGADFAKKSKEYIEQVRVMRSSLSKPKDPPRQSFFLSIPHWLPGQAELERRKILQLKTKEGHP